MAQDIPRLIADARTLLTTLPYQATERLTLTATVDHLEKVHAALTPSADTKAAYMHGFQFDFPAHDADGVKRMFTPNIPWIAIEKIMVAILAYATDVAVSQTQPADDAAKNADVGIFATDNSNYMRLTGVGKDDARLFDVRVSRGAAETLAHEIGGLLLKPLVDAMQREFMNPTVKQDHRAERGEEWEERRDVARLARQTLHPDDFAVDAFAARMKAKLASARAKGRGGWDDPAQCSVETLQAMLRDHLVKGDPVDVANFCMMLEHYGASTRLQSASASAGEA